MNISLKSAEEIELMRISGRLAAEVLEMLEPYVVPGVTTEELDNICHNYIVDVQQAIPAPLNYRGFPKSICTSINHQVCHGIPSKKKLRNGDIVNIDITVIKNGYHGDTSKMFGVGNISPHAKKLIDVTQQSMYVGINQVKPGARLGDIGFAIQKYAESRRYSVVREFCGHGIGKVFHEDPQILHYGKPNTGLELQPGLAFTIEPMINIGKRNVKILADGWTAVTKDKSLSAQWEHTLVVTETGFEILTLRNDESIEKNNIKLAG